MNSFNPLKQNLIKGLPYVILFLSIVLALFPLLFGTYQPVADDFPFIDLIENGGIISHFNRFGIWRIFGVYTGILSIISIPSFHSILVITTHFLASTFVYRAYQLLLGGIYLPLSLALLVFVFPWGYQATTWAIAYHYMLGTAFFWLNLLVIIKAYSYQKKQTLFFFVIYFLTLISLFSNESLLFTIAISGSLIWLGESKFKLKKIRQKILTMYAGWAPLLGSISYVILYHLLKSDSMPKNTSLNPETILSVYVYQFSNLYIFQPLLNSKSIPFVFYGWTGITFTCILIIICTYLVGLYIFFKFPQKYETRSILKIPKQQMLIYIIVLLLGASLIYAIGGGFSVDTRKKYSLIPLIVLLMGWLWQNYFKYRIKLFQKKLLTLLIVCALGISTNWLVIGIWKYESTRYNLLADFLVSNNITGSIRVEWEPDLYQAWPTMYQTWAFRMDDDWVLNLAVKDRGGQPVHVTQDRNAQLIRFDKNLSRWGLFQDNIVEK